MDIKLLTIAELEAQAEKAGPWAEAIESLEVAAQLLRQGNLASAKWRVDDVAALLARKVKSV